MQSHEDSRQTFWTLMFLGIVLVAGILFAGVFLALTDHNVEMTGAQTQATPK